MCVVDWSQGFQTLKLHPKMSLQLKFWKTFVYLEGGYYYVGLCSLKVAVSEKFLVLRNVTITAEHNQLQLFGKNSYL